MKRMMVLLAAACALPAAAKDALWYSQVDNDVFYGTDRWYTSGVRIARVAGAAGEAVEWGLLQEIYTPEAKRDNPIDRPNAARLLVTLAGHTRDAHGWRTLELDAGVTGPNALGRQAQDLIHRFVPAPHEEWSQQRPNHVDVQAIYSQSLDLRMLDGAWHRVKANYGVVAGNQVTYAHVGLELRIGRGDAMKASSPMLRFVATPPTLPGEAHAPGWSCFFAINVRDVMRNELLDRRRDSPLAPLVRERYVRRYATGVAWLHPYGTLTFAMAIETPEFAGQRRNQGFGTLAFDVPF